MNVNNIGTKDKNESQSNYFGTMKGYFNLMKRWDQNYEKGSKSNRSKRYSSRMNLAQYLRY